MAERSYDQIAAYILKNQGIFYRLAYLYINDREMAMDIVEESVEQALDNCGALHEDMAVDVWFHRILLDKCQKMDRIADKSIDIRRIEKTTEDSHKQTLDHIQKLDLKHRMILVLYYFEGKTLDETARILQMEQQRVELCLSELLQIL